MSIENPFQNNWKGREKEEEDFTPFRKGAIGKKITEGSHAAIHEFESSGEHSGDAMLLQIGVAAGVNIAAEHAGADEGDFESAIHCGRL